MKKTKVGVDVSKEVLDVAVNPYHPLKRFKNNAAGITEALSYIKALLRLWW